MTPFPSGHDRPGHVDAELLQTRGRDPAAVVVAALADEAGASAERGDPRGHVRRLPARGQHGARGRVRAGRERLLQPHDHVQQQVTEGADEGAHGATILPWKRKAVAGSGCVRS